MVELSFKDLTFRDIENKIKISFLNLYYFYLDKNELNKIGDFEIDKNKIIFKNIDERKVGRKFNNLLSKGFTGLKNRIGNKPTTYVHMNSGIPLIGYMPVGIVDKNVSLIEIKPLTNCNLACTFCSVDLSKRPHDFVVEKDYLVQEVKKLVGFKDISGVEININPHGEPTLYADLVDLVKDLSKIKQIEVISMNTNAVLLTKKYVDDLIEAGFTRFNVSLHALDSEKAKYLAGNKGYDIKKIIEICKYIAKKNKLLIAPVWVQGDNDEEIPKLIEFGKELGVPIRIQNFQVHKMGKKPVKKEMNWDKFYSKLKELEKEHNMRLIGDFEGFKLKKTKKLPAPFKKDDVITAKLKCAGEFPGEMVAVAENRAISVLNCSKTNGIIKLKILRDKYNIFVGKLV